MQRGAHRFNYHALSKQAFLVSAAKNKWAWTPQNRHDKASQAGGEKDIKPHFYGCLILGGVERERVLGAVRWLREALGG